MLATGSIKDLHLEAFRIVRLFKTAWTCISVSICCFAKAIQSQIGDGLFLERDAMRYALAQSLLSPVVCPSVRLSLHPSVTSVDCIQMAEGIVKPLSQLGSPIILVFFYSECQYPIPRYKVGP